MVPGYVGLLGVPGHKYSSTIGSTTTQRGKTIHTDNFGVGYDYSVTLELGLGSSLPVPLQY